MVATKRCNMCDEAKSLDDFHRMKSSPDGKQYSCKPCVVAYKRKWESENQKRLRLQARNADIRRYGIEPEDYDRMLAAQGGVCAICLGAEPTAGHSLHIDHDHTCCTTRVKCGKCVRGLLCGRCNRALGMFKDDVETLARAIDYLNAQSELPTLPHLAPVS